MPAPIIAEYSYRLLTLSGEIASEAYTLKGLQDVVEEFNNTNVPQHEVSYFKAYRSLRTFGTYCVPVHCFFDAGGIKRYNFILVIWQVGYTSHVQPVAQVQTQAAPTSSATPLDVLIEQAEQERKEATNVVWHNTYTAYYSKRNHVTGTLFEREYIWPVEAENEHEAWKKATLELFTNQKFPPVVRRVVLKG